MENFDKFSMQQANFSQNFAQKIEDISQKLFFQFCYALLQLIKVLLLICDLSKNSH